MIWICGSELSSTSLFFRLTEELRLAQNSHRLMVIVQDKRTNSVQSIAILFGYGQYNRHRLVGTILSLCRLDAVEVNRLQEFVFAHKPLKGIGPSFGQNLNPFKLNCCDFNWLQRKCLRLGNRFKVIGDEEFSYLNFSVVELTFWNLVLKNILYLIELFDQILRNHVVALQQLDDWARWLGNGIGLRGNNQIRILRRLIGLCDSCESLNRTLTCLFVQSFDITCLANGQRCVHKYLEKPT